jgi:hypothetical protein
MPRPPFPVARARRVLEEWLAVAVAMEPAEEPITIDAAIARLAARRITAHRSTIFKYKLNELLDAGRAQQEMQSRKHGAGAEAAAYAEQIDELRKKNEMLEARLREQLAVIATMTFNARSLGISEQELTAPMPKPDRTHPATGRSGRGRRRS